MDIKSIPIQPICKMTNNCNLSCKGCYYAKFLDQQADFDFSIWEKILRKIHCYNMDLKFKTFNILHGGEPMLVGPKNLSNILNLAHELGGEVGITTNFTLFDESWFDFFEEIDSVGISLNGGKKENKARIFPDGRESFGLVADNIKLLRKKRGDCGIICTVTEHNINYPKEILDYLYHDLGIRTLHFIFDDNPSFDPDAILPFLIEVWKRWIDINDQDFCVREVDDAISLALKTGEPRSCLFKEKTHCAYTWVIMPSGEVYPCDCIMITEEFGEPLGNLAEQEIEDILLSTPWKELNRFCLETKKSLVCPGRFALHYEKPFSKFIKYTRHQLNL